MAQPRLADEASQSINPSFPKGRDRDVNPSVPAVPRGGQSLPSASKTKLSKEGLVSDPPPGHTSTAGVVVPHSTETPQIYPEWREDSHRSPQPWAVLKGSLPHQSPDLTFSGLQQPRRAPLEAGWEEVLRGGKTLSGKLLETWRPSLNILD